MRYISYRNVIASQIMAKYGWKEGQGLGREEQGLSTCLQVEKTGKRAGKIINKDIEKQKGSNKAFAPPYEDSSAIEMPPPPLPGSTEDQKDDNITNMMKNPSKVVLLKVSSTRTNNGFCMEILWIVYISMISLFVSFSEERRWTFNNTITFSQFDFLYNWKDFSLSIHALHQAEES